MAFSTDSHTEITALELHEQASAAERVVSEELSVLNTIQESLLALFPDKEQNLARQALCDPLAFLGIDTQWTAPNPNALPYLLALMQRASGKDIEQFVAGLHVLHTDVKNIRRVNEEGEEFTGNFAIAFNIASMFSLPIHSPDKPLSIAIRYRGDEILVVSYAATPVQLQKTIGSLQEGNARSIDRLKQVAPAIKSIDCTLDMDPPLSVRDITIRPPQDRVESGSFDGMRPLDLVADLYNQDTGNPDSEHNHATLKFAIAQAEQTEYAHDPLSLTEYGSLPQYMRHELDTAENTPRARELARKATYNEMFPRGGNEMFPGEEIVYNPRPFLHRLCETIWENQEKKYRLVMLGPPELKALNVSSHDDGDRVLISTNRQIRKVFGESAVVHQSRGSFFAMVEEDETFADKISTIQETLTEDAVLHPEKHLDDPAIAISIVDSKTWDAFTRQIIAENQQSAGESDIPEDSLTDADPNWPAKHTLDFWKIVDSQRPLHYTEELLQVIRNVPPESLTKVVYERFITRINIIREQLMQSARLRAVDLDLLNTVPTHVEGMEEFIDYLSRINDVCRRITLDEDTISLQVPKLGLQTLQNVGDFLSVSRPDESLTHVTRPWETLTVPR